MFLKIERRYSCFLLGIIVASFTWAVSIYLYWSLNKEKYVSHTLNSSIGYRRQMQNDIVIPYEDDEKKRWRAKSKYYDPNNLIKKDDIIRQKLNPVPIKAVNDNEMSDIGIVRSLDDLKVRNEGYKLHGFNALISKNLDYHRIIPDTRNKLCKSTKYSDELPHASIIICFYNEQFDTLARTVHSILDRTPANLLHEIILVNDFSDNSGLYETVKLYINANLSSKVKLYSTSQREGLIRARLFGSDKASGDVLVFLDSHVEVNVQWLEPLLQRIYENKTAVVTPIIDIINADTFEYSPSPIVRGGFNWGLHFKWENLRAGFLGKAEDFIKPIPSPTMAGGLFAIDRQYFNSLGKYDSGMNIWGGENLEISFRIWMCGGSLEIIPCSRVGHVFRKRRPYGSPDGEDTMIRNSLRVAHVWMDEFKEYYFRQRPEAVNVHFGDVSSRITLRKSLNCHSFSWYLKNVYPELTLPTDSDDIQQKKSKLLVMDQKKRNQVYIGHYQLRLSNSGLCLASEKDMKTKGSRLVLRNCLRVKNQLWSQTDKGELRLAQYLCLDGEEVHPRLSKCHEMGGTQKWKHKFATNVPVYNVAAGMCLAAEKSQVNSYVIMDICSSNQKTQWDFIPVSLK